MGSSTNLSPPTTAPPSPGSVTSNIESIIRPRGWGRSGGGGSTSGGDGGGSGGLGGGHLVSSPAPREVGADDAPPELDALRPFSETRAISRRVPVMLAPVGVGGDSSPLPSLFSATASVASDPVPPQWVSSQWQSQHERINAKDLHCQVDATPAHLGSHSGAMGAGMRTRTGTDPGPSRALLEAAKVAVSHNERALGQCGSSRGAGDRGAEESRRRSYIQARTVSSGGEIYHDALDGGEAGHLNRRSSSGGEPIPRAGGDGGDGGGGGGGGDGRGRGGVDHRFGVYEPALATKHVNGFSGVGGAGDTPGGPVGGVGSGSATGGGRSSGVRIRGGGIDITSLLSEERDTDGGLPGRGDDSRPSSGRNASDFHGVHGYHSQDSNASSVGEYGGYGLGGNGSGRLGSGNPALNPGAEYRADWPGGRPPLVRKRSLTVAMDADPGGGSAGYPSPRGRRRSLDKVTDLSDSARLESPSCPPRPLSVPSRNLGGNGNIGGGSGGPMSLGSGRGGSGCFSPRHFGGGISTAAAGGGSRDTALASPSHDRFGQSMSVMASSSAGGLSSVGEAATSSSCGASGAPGPMDVDWRRTDNPYAVSPPVSAVTPSPIPSLSSSAPSGSLVGRSPGPFAPSPAHEYLRTGVGHNRTPHSPSPRGPPPSPAQAPGSGVRRRGTRRLSGSRAAGRGGQVWVRSGSLGRTSFDGTGGSGTYESDYDSDLSELSAYSAMGSLEQQLQQDTFFELDEALWVVVTRREVRTVLYYCIVTYTRYNCSCCLLWVGDRDGGDYGVYVSCPCPSIDTVYR